MTMTISNEASWFVPDWDVPPNVRSLTTTRVGGVSRGQFASLNLGDHVGDDPIAVAANRRRLTDALQASPLWLQQVHGTRVIDAGKEVPGGAPPQADAALARETGVVCTVMTADCLPVLFCDSRGSVVAAAHAGWRGLLDGVLEATVSAMGVAGERIFAWLGPAIGPKAFEVGQEVRDAFVAIDSDAASAFQSLGKGKWLADIFQLARQRLARQGVLRVSGGQWCTFGAPERFFSYRRDGQTGRMATMIWLERSAAFQPREDQPSPR